MKLTKLFHDDRAVSEVVSYMLSLSILLMVVTSIGLTGTQHMDRITDQHATNQLEGVGQQVAYEYQFIDQAVRDNSNPASAIARSVNLPRTAAGQQYSISVEELSQGELYYRYRITLSSGEGARATVPIETRIQITEKTIQSGSIEILRPQPSDANINSGFCEPLDTNSKNGIQSFEDSRGNNYEPDTCKITMQEDR